MVAWGSPTIEFAKANHRFFDHEILPRFFEPRGEFALGGLLAQSLK
jgi:uncharacterized protein YifE (UPF0438 family)